MVFSHLSTHTRKHKYPLPLTDCLSDQLEAASYLYKIDMRSGFHQHRVRGEDLPKMVDRSRYGNYEFLVISFGVTNAGVVTMCVCMLFGVYILPKMKVKC